MAVLPPGKDSVGLQLHLQIQKSNYFHFGQFIYKILSKTVYFFEWVKFNAPDKNRMTTSVVASLWPM